MYTVYIYHLSCTTSWEYLLSYWIVAGWWHFGTDKKVMRFFLFLMQNERINVNRQMRINKREQQQQNPRKNCFRPFFWLKYSFFFLRIRKYFINAEILAFFQYLKWIWKNRSEYNKQADKRTYYSTRKTITL